MSMNSKGKFINDQSESFSYIPEVRLLKEPQWNGTELDVIFTGICDTVFSKLKQ